MNALVLAASWFDVMQEFDYDPRYSLKIWYVNQYIKDGSDTRRITLFHNLTKAQAEKIAKELTVASNRVKALVHKFGKSLFK